MKNFLFLIGIALIVVSCNQSSTTSSTETKKSNNTATPPQPIEMTLNGFTKANAGDMVMNFLKHKGIYGPNSKTNIWFSKTYIDKLDTFLRNENRADGFRIYFAKDNSNKYSIVMVSTRNNKGDHQDYFDHKDLAFVQFLNSSITNGKIDHTGKPNNGAILHDLVNCPARETCDMTNPNTLGCYDAYAFVQNAKPMHSKDTINTISEYLPIEVLHLWVKELGTVTNTKTPPDGIRIYYSRKNIIEKGKYRYHFVFMTTKKDTDGMSRDYIGCNAPSFNSKQNINDAKKISHTLMEIKNLITDNGEQCRTQCDGTTWVDVRSID